MNEQNENVPAWVVYTESLYPLLDNFITQKANPDVSHHLQVSYGFFSYHIDNLRSKMTKNEEYWNSFSVFIAYFHDNMRALIPLNNTLHVAPTAFILRSSLEALGTFKYIIQQPEERFDLYHRHLLVERVLAHNDGIIPLSDPFLQNLKSQIPEWIKQKKSGEYIERAWTADSEYKIFEIMKDVGLESDFKTVYSHTSIFVHCRSTLKNVYSEGNTLTPIPTSNRIHWLSLAAARYGIHFLQTLYEFGGAEIPAEDMASLNNMFTKVSDKHKLG
jgi:hypothetical protein